MTKTETTIKPALMPTIDYDSYIIARAKEVDGASSFTLLKLRELITQWSLIGNLYADMLENPDVSVALKNAILDEVSTLEEASGCETSTTNPGIIRLLYPWMRDMAMQGGVSWRER